MKYKPEDIFTPQGILAEVENSPNLDFLMNVFNIPRAFGVSGFGNPWNVGQHSFATALIALLWAKYNNFSLQKRDALVVMAVTHDLHESVTGDILPMFKSPTVKTQLNKIQDNILTALNVTEDPELKTDLKIIDLVAFLYEIKQVSPSILNSRKLTLANKIADRQRDVLYAYCKENKISRSKIQQFMDQLEL